MFKIELSGGKMVSVVMAPYVPSVAVAEMNLAAGAGAEATEIQVVPCLQIYEPNGDVICSLMMNEADILNLNNLLITVGKSCGRVAVVLSSEFNMLMAGRPKPTQKMDPFGDPGDGDVVEVNPR